MCDRKLTKKAYCSLSLVAMGQTRFGSLTCSLISGNAKIKIWPILISESVFVLGIVLGAIVFQLWVNLWCLISEACGVDVSEIYCIIAQYLLRLWNENSCD